MASRSATRARLRRAFTGTSAAVVATAALFVSSASAAPSAAGAAAGGWQLTTTEYQPSDYSRQAFVGNGRLGAMIPATGQGYQGSLGPTGWPLYTERYAGSFIAGFYGLAGRSEYIAAVPSWSTLEVGVGGSTYAAGVPADQVSAYRQTLDLHHGVLTTALTWTAPDGRATRLRYELFADRDSDSTAAVRLTATPQWSGDLQVTDLLDGAGARRTTGRAQAYDAASDTATVVVRAQQTTRDAAEVSALAASANVAPTSRTGAGLDRDQTAGQRWTIPVTAGQSYTITKYVGVATEDDGADPRALATAAAQRARSQGWDALRARSDAAWEKVWRHDVEVDDPTVQAWTRASLYSLLSNLRPEQSWSIAPAGISSDTYAGMIFWDAETWMFPSLLALHPELAKSVVDLRFRTLQQAYANAREVGRTGAVWPWTNGPSMTCGGPGPCRDYQDHLQNEIVLAQWQYYEATGDRDWLRERGWPVIKGVAEFWTGRVTQRADGFHVLGVSGADEYANGVDDHAMTNAGAAKSLAIADRVARLVGAQPDPRWADIAANMYVPFDPDTGVHPEYAGYSGGKIKQADTVLMTYPYEIPMDPSVAAADLDYYAPRTDPDGPAMTDSVHAVIAAQIAEPGCQTWTYLQRSVAPFVRAPFLQFSEARGSYAGDNAGAPAYVFETGAGGYLQTLLYGLTGQRWREGRVVFKPLLPPQLAGGVTVRGMQYQGRSLTLTLGSRRSRIRLEAGDPLAVETTTGTRTLRPGKALTVETRRPDLEPTANVARCEPATATGSALGSYPDAAVDGSTATPWRTAEASGELQVDLGKVRPVQAVVIDWYGDPATHYAVDVSRDGARWTTVREIDGAAVRRGVVQLRKPTPARRVRVRVLATEDGKAGGISELSVMRRGRNAGPTVSLDAPAQVEHGSSFEVGATLTNDDAGPITDARLALRLPEGWRATPTEDTAASRLRPHHALNATWIVTAGPSAGSGRQDIVVDARWTRRGEASEASNTATLHVLPAAPHGTQYLSDLDPISADNGYGPYERDRDNGETAAGDGKPLTLQGTVYAKGLGTNSPAELVYNLGGRCQRFTAVVGIDDSMVASGGTQGDVVFRVLADDRQVVDTGVVRGGDQPVSITADVSGAQRLTLAVDQWDENNWWDHADWADAKVTCEP